MLLTDGAHHIQHMHKALQQMHRKLSQVVSDLTGATGMALLKAIIAGERDPLTLAKLRNPHCQHSEDDIAKALQGTWRAEHLFALQQAVELYQFYHQQLTVCDQHMQTHLGTFADKSHGQPLPPKARRHKKANEPRFDARTPRYRLAGGDLTTIEGIEEGTAWVILSEIGTDMRRWPSVKHFCSWLGSRRSTKFLGARCSHDACAPGRSAWPWPCASPRARSTRRTPPWEPSFGVCGADWAPPRPSRRRRTSSRGWSTAC
jgi:transposase